MPKLGIEPLDLQSDALPTELFRPYNMLDHIKISELLTPSVTIVWINLVDKNSILKKNCIEISFFLIINQK
jgi:hypothetical protein